MSLKEENKYWQYWQKKQKEIKKDINLTSCVSGDYLGSFGVNVVRPHLAGDETNTQTYYNVNMAAGILSPVGRGPFRDVPACETDRYGPYDCNVRTGLWGSCSAGPALGAASGSALGSAVNDCLNPL
ncbi:unnamed protein product [Arctogadus glacialis]